MAAARSAPEAPSGSSFCEPSGRITCMEGRMLDAAGLRAAVRADAFDFLRFCVHNPKPCPVLDVTDLLMITHASGHTFVTDARDETMATL
jgi:uncharacterized protein YcsI (UPF0317 family)